VVLTDAEEIVELVKEMPLALKASASTQPSDVVEMVFAMLLLTRPLAHALPIVEDVVLIKIVIPCLEKLPITVTIVEPILLSISMSATPERESEKFVQLQ
jgi:hypothetical protein